MISVGSRETLLANVVQQGCASALLFALPNFLGKEDYAQVVFVGVLLSFLVLADIGLSLVYCRLLPAVIASGDVQKISIWDASVSTLGLILSFAFSLLVSALFLAKYNNVSHAIILSLLPMGLFLVSFHASRATVSGNFREYRRATSARALSSLIAIPLAALGGLSGWFWSQLLAILFAIIYLGTALLEPLGRIDWQLVRKHIPEGLLLCATTAGWLQLLNFGRLYAGLFYPPESVAHFGVAGSAYQSLSSLLTSIFLPMTVGILARIGKGDREAFEFMASVLARSTWWVLAVAILMSELSPFLLKLIFPEYQFDHGALLALMLSIAFYPFFLLLGNCMVGKQKAGLYLVLIAISLSMSAGISIIYDSFDPGNGAAWGQLVGLVFFAAGLWVVTSHLFGHAARGVWRYIGKTLLKVILLVAFYASLRESWYKIFCCLFIDHGK